MCASLIFKQSLPGSSFRFGRIKEKNIYINFFLGHKVFILLFMIIKKKFFFFNFPPMRRSNRIDYLLLLFVHLFIHTVEVLIQYKLLIYDHDQGSGLSLQCNFRINTPTFFIFRKHIIIMYKIQISINRRFYRRVPSKPNK